MNPRPILTARAPSAGYRRRLLIQILGMLTLALGVGLAIIGFGYSTKVGQEKEWLTEIAKGQARLTEVMTRAAGESSPGASPEEAFGIVLSQLRQAQEAHPGFGETGEFTLAELQGDSIFFLLNQRHSELSEPAPIAVSSPLAEPMRRALGGLSGMVVGLDYRGVEVMAAHEPVRISGRVLGIVAKVDYAAIRAPFNAALVRATGAALLFIALGVLLMWRVGEPVVEVLRKNEERLRRLFDDSGGAIFITSGEGIILDVNPAGADLLGRSREDLFGNPILEFYSLEGERELFLEELRLHGRIEGFPLDLRRADGAVIHTLITATARKGKGKGKGGEIESIESMVRDITSEMKAAAALEAERDRANLYLDTAKVIMLSLDISGKIVMMNRRGYEVLGHPEGSLLGKEWFSTCLPERDREEIRAVFGTIMSGDQDLFLFHENPVLKASGEERLIGWHNKVVLDKDGAIKELFSCGQDVTEERRAEEALRESEERFRSIFEEGPLGVAITDRGGFLSAVNPAFVRMLGYPEEELLGRQHTDLSHSEDLEPTLTLTRRLLAGEIPVFHLETRYLRKDGTHFWGSLSGAPIRDAQGEVLYAIGLLEDISERKSAQDEIRQSRELLRALARRLEEIREEEKTMLARELHDELGQSLTGLRMDLGVLRQEVPEGEDQLRARIGEMAEYTDGLVDEFRDICGKLRPPILDVLGLQPAIEWHVGEFQRRSGMEFELDFGSEGLSLEKDVSTVVYRLIQEAIVNSMRHAEARKVRVALNQGKRTLLGEVSDDGRGITRDEISSPTSLGLVGMRERLIALGGELQIEPGAEGGTVVRFQIPIGMAGAPENAS